jgi:hypothetical protein
MKHKPHNPRQCPICEKIFTPSGIRARAFTCSKERSKAYMKAYYQKKKALKECDGNEWWGIYERKDGYGDG